MSFNSPAFALFFAAVFCLYWSVRGRSVQTCLLLAASYVFYSLWSWKLALVLLFSTALNYWLARSLLPADGRGQSTARLGFGVAANLLILVGLKYHGLVFGAALPFFQSTAAYPATAPGGLLATVGVSFYTLQAIGYLVDVYRGELEPVGSFTTFALYQAYFPRLLAGPLQRAREMLAQLAAPRALSASMVDTGLTLVAWGLFKKMVIADNLAPYVDAVYRDPTPFGGLALVTATVFFSFQVYCDFSGYADCARGFSRMLGFELPVNFRPPYMARSPGDFWQRWNITLSQWFGDYVLGPLSSRLSAIAGRLGSCIAVLATLCLLGVWHGAGATYLAFGVYWGAVLIALLPFGGNFGRAADADGMPARGSSGLDRAVRTVGSVALTYLVACVGWILFRSSSLGSAAYIIGHLGSRTGFAHVLRPDVVPERTLWCLLAGLVVIECLSEHAPALRGWALGGERRRLLWRHALLVCLLFTYIVYQHDKSVPFLLFQF